MLSITIEFLHGTYRAGSADDLAITGAHDSRGEWPPSPARLYAALVAGGGTGDRCYLTEGTAGLDLLESAPPPVIYADAPEQVELTALAGRFAVVDETGGSGVQNYPARQAQLIRPGVRISMSTPRVRYVWADVAASDLQLRGLRLRAARIGYLGCADSPVRVTVSTSPGDLVGDTPERAWVPGDRGSQVLPVPAPGYLVQLDEAFDDWIAGRPRRRAWSPSAMAAYRAPGGIEEAPQPHTIWLRFDRALVGHRALLVAETLRNAVLERYQQLVAGGDRNAVPMVLHGHAESEKNYQHAHWLVLPHVGAPYADGRIRGACIWLPAETEPAVVIGTRLAASSISTLTRPGVFSVGVEAFDGTRRPWTSNPQRWRGPARRWVSVFPVVHERYTRRRGVTLDEVARWCRHAGLPDPIRARTSPAPLLEGSPTLHSRDIFRPGRERRPFSHVEVEFATAVTGPVALGRARQFGIGLLAPVGGRSDG